MTTALGGAFVNSATGVISLQSGSLTFDTAELSNEGVITLDDGVTSGSSNSTVVISGATGITNTSIGTFNLNDGTLQLSGPVVNGGQMFFSSGTGNATKVTISGTVPLENAAAGTLSLKTGTLTLSGNNIVNNGTTLYDGDTAVTFDGSGRFINNGTFNHQVSSGNDNLVLAGSVVFENNGTFDFQNRGEIDFNGGNAVFENNGTLIKTAAGADQSFVFRSGTFNANAGSFVTAKEGILHFGVDGTSDASATWTADGDTTAAPILQFAGEWTGTLAGSAIEGGIVRIGSSGNGAVTSGLSIGSMGLIFNFTGDGIDWQQEVIATQGNTATNVGLFMVGSGNPGTRTLSGGGEFLNANGGTFSHSSGEITFADASVLRNQGAYEINPGGSTKSFAGAGSFVNDTGGVLTYNGGTFNVATPATFRNLGAFNIEATAAFTGDGAIINGTTGTVNWNSVSNLSIDIGTNFQNDGLFTVGIPGDRLITGGGTFTNNGTFSNAITSGADNVGWSGVGEFINNGAFQFESNGDYRMEGGTTFTNAATGVVSVNSVSTDPAQFFSFAATSGFGTFNNQGTVEVTAGRFRITTSASNTGTLFDDLVLTQNNGSGTLTGGTWVAAAASAGSAIIDLEPFGDASGITTIGQGAVVELSGAGAELVQLSSLTTVNGGLYVNGDQSLSPSVTQITLGSTGTLGGDGELSTGVLVNGGSLSPGANRGASLGLLSLNGDVSLTAGSMVLLGLGSPTGIVSNSLSPMDVALAILAAGDMDPTGGQHDAVDVTGTLTFDPTITVMVTNDGASFAYGQYFDLFDFAGLGIAGVTQVEAEGALILPALGGLLWDTSLFQSDGIVFVVPEPSRAVLLVLGLSLLAIRRRR